MRLFRRQAPLPPALRAALRKDEHILAVAPAAGGSILAASRFGLWVCDADAVGRIDWHLVSKARLAGGAVELTVADEVGQWPSGVVVLSDRPPMVFRPTADSKLTDIIHDRVRRSVVASRHLPWPGAGGWVVVRKVAGRDGLAVQLRLDPDADPLAPGFAAAATDLANALRLGQGSPLA